MQQLGSVVSLPQLKKSAKAIELRGEDRYLCITAYERRDDFSPKVSSFVIDQTTQDEILPPSGANLNFISKSGQYSIVPGVFSGFLFVYFVKTCP